jgi:hypothetical protein
VKKNRALAVAASLLVVVLSALVPIGLRSASAATGDLVHETHFATRCPSGVGLGVAFDGTYLWYSCIYGGPDLFRVDPVTGDLEGSWDIAGGIGAITYDATDNAIWAGWDSMHPQGDVTYIPLDAEQNVVTAGVTVKFNIGSNATSALDDGIAYDATDNDLYISPDLSTTIYRYTTSGTYVDSRPWVGTGTTCQNSGLAIGADELYEGVNGCEQVAVADRATNTLTNTISAPGIGRLEGLACDPQTFYPKDVLWVVGNTGASASAYEIPASSCGTGGRNGAVARGIAEAYSVSAIVKDASGATLARTGAVADARTTSGTVTNTLADVPLPAALGDVTVGANKASITQPFDGTGYATARLASVTIDIPPVAGVTLTPCHIHAEGVFAGVRATSPGADGPYHAAEDPSSAFASLTVCGRPAPLNLANASIVLPNGLGTVTTFEQTTSGSGSDYSEFEVDALHVHLTLPSETADIKVGAAYIGVRKYGSLTPRDATTTYAGTPTPPPVPTPPSPPPTPTVPVGATTGGCTLTGKLLPGQTQVTGTMTEASVTRDRNGALIGATVGCAVWINGIAATPVFQYPGPNGIQSGSNDVAFYGSPSDPVTVCKDVSYADGNRDFTCANATWSPDGTVVTGVD